MNRSEFMIM